MVSNRHHGKLAGRAGAARTPIPGKPQFNVEAAKLPAEGSALSGGCRPLCTRQARSPQETEKIT